MISDKPNCFIAMAFGHKDTDIFYRDQILPVLKRNNIKSIIINRRESNTDLNIQIIEQLVKADFCIADLTYARPSVYFEAGFAQCSIPVIYTVRTDHLHNKEDDLRVHFDLQMKPIIDWNETDDHKFANRLERRLRVTFLNNWNRNKEIELLHADSEEQFSNMSLERRLQLLRYETIHELVRIGFNKNLWDVSRGFQKRNHKYDKGQILAGSYNYSTALKNYRQSTYCCRRPIVPFNVKY